MSANERKAHINLVNARLIEKQIELYERGYFVGPNGNHYPLSAGQIAQIKSNFAVAKTACIAALNGITG